MEYSDILLERKMKLVCPRRANKFFMLKRRSTANFVGFQVIFTVKFAGWPENILKG